MPRTTDSSCANAAAATAFETMSDQNKKKQSHDETATGDDDEMLDANKEGELVSKDTMTTIDSDDRGNDADDDVAEKAASLKSNNSSKKKKQQQRRRRRKQQQQPSDGGPSNQLTKLLPGYVAPMKLMMAPSLVDRYRALPAGANRKRRGGEEEDETLAPSPASLVAGLDALRRKAVQQDCQTKSVKSLQQHAQVMLQTNTTASSSLYMTSHASFKKGTKRPPISHAGDGWFGMQPTPMSSELQRDLLLIRNRNYLDPKRFYKSADNSKKQASKFVQAGTVIEGNTEFYSSRLAKRQRRGNLVEEIMAESSSMLSNNNRKQSSSGGGAAAASTISNSSADYVMKKYKTMQHDSRTKSQAWHKRNNGKGRRKPQRR